jgi:hypothetical protein
MKNKSVISIIILFIIYIASAGISYSVFSKGGTETGVSSVDVGTTKNDFEQITFDDSKPRTEACPLNGTMYSKDQRNWWEKHRPLGVMIENHVEARPQSGISFADVVYEAVAEGGITRFLAVYYCQDAGIVGPVRSARTYFLDYISEYGDYPLYAHVGGANTPGPANALGQIVDYGWNQYNDLNQFSIGFPTFRRDEARAGRPVATEHTVYSTTSNLWKIAEQRKLTNVDEDGKAWDEDFTVYEFKDDPGTNNRPTSQTARVEHWKGYGDFTVEWTYDRASNSYLRKNGGSAHNDRNTKKQITAKTVVMLLMPESNANDGYEGNLHLLYSNKGTGKAVILMDGKRVNATWSKKSRISRTILTANDGSEIKFSRGQIWFHILPLEGVVEVR